MWTVLFDIDGTLLHSGGAGRRAMERAAFRLFGAPKVPRLELAGRTDHAIFHELLTALGLPAGDWYPAFRRQYHVLLAEELEKSFRTGSQLLLGGVLPLVRDLLESGDWRIGLLTGNSREGARIKLGRAGIEGYFSAGGFGDWTSCRAEVARSAGAAVIAPGSSIDPGSVVVVGDSVHDIRCARACGFRAVAVATGGTCADVLLRECPDHLVASLNEVKLHSLRLLANSRTTA